MRERNGITVLGAGAAKAAVDQVDLELGIEVVRADAGEAFQAAAATATTLLAVLADRGVDSRHVRTAQLRLGPKMTYRDGEERLVGYAAGQNLSATLRGLSTLGPLLTDVATARLDGVRIDSVSLSSSNPSDASAQAREAAIADAQARAQQYARLVGRALGDVISIEEIAAGQNPRSMREAKMMSAIAGDMPIGTGDDVISANVSVRFAFAERDQL